MQDRMSGMENVRSEDAGTPRNAASLVSLIQPADTKGNNINGVTPPSNARRSTSIHVQDGSRHLLSAADSRRPLWRRGVPVMYAPKTCALYREVCRDVRSRPVVCLWARNGRRWQTSVAAFQEVFGSITVSGCWFHHSQAVLKCANKLGLKRLPESWRYQRHYSLNGSAIASMDSGCALCQTLIRMVLRLYAWP